jgi:uncharacterized protein (DUF427 family)
MPKSPGHREHPEHKVLETHLDHDVRVDVNGERVATSHDVVKVEEDGSPARYYFRRADVAMDKLTRSDMTTKCPYKRTARYFGIRAGRRVAFHEDEFPEISIAPST